MEEKQNKLLSTKVTPEVYARMLAICKKFGFNIFLCLRMLAETFCRFGDDRHNLNDELIRAMRIFENIPGWSKAICLFDPEQEFGIVEAFYVLRAKGKDGHRIIHVERPTLDGDAEGWKCTNNINSMLERFIEIINPSLYKHLRSLAVELGTSSMFDTIHRIAESFIDNPDEMELRIQFEKCTYHQGDGMSDKGMYKRPYSHTMDYVEKTLPIFDESDKEE